MVAARSPRSRPALSTIAGLLLTGFLGSMTTLRADLVPDLLPNLLPPLQRQVLALGIALAVATAAALVRRSNWPKGTLLRAAILLGLGLFVLPTLLSLLASISISPLTRAALWSLAPFFAVVFEPYLSAEAPAQNRGALLAAIASASGTLLVLPINLPESLPTSLAWLAMGLAAACVGAISCVAFGVTMALAADPETSPGRVYAMAPFAAVSSGTGFLGLAAILVFTHSRSVPWQALPSTLVWTSAIDLPGLALVFWLMPRLSAPRITTRFPLALLFPVILGALLLRSPLSMRDWSGVAMMLTGTAYLLFARDDLPDSHGLSLR